VLIYGILFGTGKLLLHETGIGITLITAGLIGGAVIYWDLSRRGWSVVVE
jgi:SSS family solute:Na+ symporter